MNDLMNMPFEELQHSGTKGMHWGVRLYQNKDGSLTALGRKRYGTKTNFNAVQRAKAKARTDAELAKIEKKSTKKISKITGKKPSEADESKPKGKSLSEMTDAELKERVSRLQLEKQFRDLVPKPSEPKVSKGKQLADSLMDAAIGAVKEKGKKAIGDYLEKEVKKALGIKPSEMEVLKKEAEKWDLKSKISTYKETVAKNTEKQLARDREDTKRQKKAEKKATKAAEEKKRQEEAYEERVKEIEDEFLKRGYIFQSGIMDLDVSELYGDDRVNFSEGELRHFGILGMKWGVRRYQNKDGSLTSKGKKHAKQLADNRDDVPDYEKLRSESRERHGIKVSGGDDDYISKGSAINRIANSKETLDDKRKYVSLTKEDSYTYGEVWDMLGLDTTKPISDYVYEAKKDLRIASGKKVCDDLINKYGDKRIKDLHEVVKDSYGKESMDFLNDHSSERDEIQKFIRNTIKANEKEISKEYASKNYDGYVDAEDWVTGLAEYPVILLNPKNNVTLKSEESWEEKYRL